MHYAYTQFAGVQLPRELPDHDIGTDESLAPMVAMPGRAPYDPLGEDRAALAGRVVSVDLAATGATESILGTTLDALRGLVGVSDVLYVRTGGGGSRWRMARLLSVPSQGQAPHFLHQPLTLMFQLLGEQWNGSLHSATYTLASENTDCVVPNNGNIPVRNALITVRAMSAAIAQVSVGVSGVSAVSWTGALSVGQYLYIDCGSWSVKKNATDAYSTFTRDASHTIDEWLRLEKGNNTVRVTRVGGGPDSWAKFTFYDGWA